MQSGSTAAELQVSMAATEVAIACPLGLLMMEAVNRTGGAGVFLHRLSLISSIGSELTFGMLLQVVGSELLDSQVRAVHDSVCSV